MSRLGMNSDRLQTPQSGDGSSGVFCRNFMSFPCLQSLAPEQASCHTPDAASLIDRFLRARTVAIITNAPAPKRDAVPGSGVAVAGEAATKPMEFGPGAVFPTGDSITLPSLQLDVDPQTPIWNVALEPGV